MPSPGCTFTQVAAELPAAALEPEVDDAADDAVVPIE
jgi:hypothetical protein